jgi:hypothetical protein
MKPQVALGGRRSKDQHHHRSHHPWLIWCFLGRSERITSAVCLVSAVCFVVGLGGQRIASHRVNTQELVKLPINDIERECPPPDYKVLGRMVDTTDGGSSSSSSQPPRPRICLTTLTDAANADFLQRLVRWRNFNALLSMTWPNKERYCRQHGYLLFDESSSLDTSRPPSWSKIRAAQRLLTEENCEWVFWMDADTVIMNSAIRIEDFLPLPDSGIDLLLTRQKGDSWNAGAWLVRNTPWSLEFLDHWWNMKEYVKAKGLSVSGDNDALKAYLSGMDQEYFDAHIAVPERCTFNSVAKFMTKEYSATLTPELVKKQEWYLNLERYHKGDFVAHVAGT